MSDSDDKILARSKPAINAYMKYSGMGIQMALIIGIFSWLGVKADEWLQSKPLFVVLLSLSGVALAIFVFVRQILRSEQQNKADESES